MTLSRRELLAGLGGVGLTAALGPVPPTSFAVSSLTTAPLPARADFTIPDGQTYLNSAFIHPMPRAAAEAARHYLEQRALKEERRSGDSIAAEIKGEFARLINAKPTEISLVQNTSTGENLVVRGLGLPDGKRNVVTDGLHFDGSLVMYGELRKHGLDVRLAPMHDWRIRLEDLDARIDRNTRLVALSMVSMYNGWQHDLKAVCDLAHARGACVYADLIQAADNTPIDVRATGLDFGACSSFKWLMGDFGLGFLYVKEELLERVVQRTLIGYQQADTEDHSLPEEPPAEWPVSWTMHPEATGHFEAGTFSQSAAVCLSASLAYIQRIGVSTIEAYRQPMLLRLRREMPRLGFEPITPEGTTSARIAFHRKGAEQEFSARLQQARVNISLSGGRLRVSASAFNTMGDVEQLLEAISR